MVTRIGVLGASGRAGSKVVDVLSESPELQLSAAMVAPNCTQLGQICLIAGKNQGQEVCFSCALEEGVARSDVLIDFSSPASALALARLCAMAGKPLFIGTTGLDETQRAELKELSRRIAILIAPNASLGAFVLRELCLQAQQILGTDFDIEVLELHHGLKKDAPSGTARELANSLAIAGLSIQNNRVHPRQKNEIGVAALRGGDVVGDHSVFFLGKGERLEITHRAADRSIFARGAVKGALRLIGKGAGLYSMRDLWLSFQ